MLVALAVAVVAPAPAAGAGALQRVPGDSPRSGPGTLFRYVVAVERSIRTDRQRFADQIQDILFDERSWTGTRRVAFRRVRRNPDTRIILARPDTVDRLCHPLPTNGTYSCRAGQKVVLNHHRWRRAVSHWPSSRASYRRMLLNHEVGHRIGHGHRSCPRPGAKAPVMQQQSSDLQGCRANWWPKRSELRATKRLYRGSAAASARSATTGDHVD